MNLVPSNINLTQSFQALLKWHRPRMEMQSMDIEKTYKFCRTLTLYPPT
jgi:hypothetical protein